MLRDAALTGLGAALGAVARFALDGVLPLLGVNVVGAFLDMYLTGFRSFDMGGASVIGVILVVIGLAMSLGLNRATGAHRMESQMEGQ